MLAVRGATEQNLCDSFKPATSNQHSDN